MATTPLEILGYLVLAALAGLAVVRDAKSADRDELPIRELGDGPAGTARDPRVKRMVERQTTFGRRLQKWAKGRSILHREDYTPELTKKAE